MNDTTTTLPLRNPRTGQSDGQLPIVPADAVAALGQALRAAQPAWAALDIEARCQRLSALADALVAAGNRQFYVEVLRKPGKRTPRPAAAADLPPESDFED